MALDPGAFELPRPDGSPVGLTVAASVVDGRTVAVLTFGGPEVVGGSRADQVHDRFGRELDGDADGLAGGDRAAGFHRLFGDSDGDGRDNGQFNRRFGQD